MSSPRINDMAVVIYLPDAEYLEGCGPGAIGTVRAVCSCSRSFICMITNDGVMLEFETPAGTFCVWSKLLRKIDPPEKGTWDTCVWKPTKESVT